MVDVMSVKNDTGEMVQSCTDNKSQNQQVNDNDSFNENLKKAKDQLKKQYRKSDNNDSSVIPGGLFSVSELQPLHEVKVDMETSVSEESEMPDVDHQSSSATVNQSQTAASNESLNCFSAMVDSIVVPKDGSSPYMDIIINATNPVDPSFFAEELAKYINKLQINIKEIELRVYPRELGQIDVKVSFDEGKINISIAVSEQFKEYFQKNLDTLSSVLESKGIDIGQMDIMSGQSNGNSSNHGENDNYLYGEDSLETVSGDTIKTTGFSVVKKSDSTINNMI